MAINMNGCIYGWTSAEFRVVAKCFDDAGGRDNFVREIKEDYPSLCIHLDDEQLVCLWNTLIIFTDDKTGKLRIDEVEY